MTIAPVEDLADTTTQALRDTTADLSANADVRADLRRKATGVELKMALRDLRDGVRGMIRVSPLTSVFAAALVGAAWSRRRRVRR